MKTKISIVVPIYNVEEYVERCIISVKNQTYENIEIILVNDGSQDNSLDICNQYANHDSRIKVINKNNGGLSEARNLGIEKSTGEYILLVDGDDSIEVTTCEELVNIIENNLVDMVIFKHNKIINENKISSNDSYRIEVINSEEAYRRYLYGEEVIPAAWSKLYKRNLFNEIKFPKGKLAEDFATAHKYILQCEKIAYYDKSLYNYYIRENSIMGRKPLKLTLDYYEAACSKFEMEKKLFDKYKRQVNTLYVNCLLRTIARLNMDNNRDQYTLNILNDAEKRIDKMKSEEVSLKTRCSYYLYKLNLKAFCCVMKMSGKDI